MFEAAGAVLKIGLPKSAKHTIFVKKMKCSPAEDVD
jgi:hypothetical protein